MPGVIPMRSEELSRERDANRSGRPKLTKGKSVPSKPIAVNLEWKPTVRQLYQAALKSGMREYYEATDWAYLYMLCDELNTLMVQRDETGKMSVGAYQAVMAALTNVGLTEGDRRRSRIELEKEEDLTAEADVQVAHISAYREKLSTAHKRRES